eukprot:34287_1
MDTLVSQLLLLLCISLSEGGLFLGKDRKVSDLATTDDSRKKQSRFKNKMIFLVNGIEEDYIGEGSTTGEVSALGTIPMSPNDRIDSFTSKNCGGVGANWDAFRECLATCCYTQWATVVNQAMLPFFADKDIATYIQDKVPKDRQNPFTFFMRALWDATHRTERWKTMNSLITEQNSVPFSAESTRKLTKLVKQSDEDSFGDKPFPPEYTVIESITSTLNIDKLVLWRGYSQLIMLPGDKITDEESDILYGPSSFTTDILVAMQFATRTGLVSGVVIRADIPKADVAELKDFGFLDIAKANYLSEQHQYQKEVLLYNVPVKYLSVEQCVDSWRTTDMDIHVAKLHNKCKVERDQRAKAAAAASAGAHVEQYDVINDYQHRYRHRRRPNYLRSRYRLQRLQD